jgi:sugar lactone lactonase YvrE
MQSTHARVAIRSDREFTSPILRSLHLLAILAAVAASASPSAAQSQAYHFTTFAGASTWGRADGPGASARFNEPLGVATDSSGNVYVADRYNHTIRRITPDGTVSTLAGLPGFEGSVDGTGKAARFSEPAALTVDAAGNVFVADYDNHTIRRITPAGVVSTVAGQAGSTGTANGVGAAARFNKPSGLAFDAAGVLHVAEYGNHTVRRIASDGTVTTLAGQGGVVGTANGTGTAARFNSPIGIAVDSAGDVYVAEYGNHSVRKITAAGVVSTLAGQPGTAGALDGNGTAARFRGTSGLWLEPGGTSMLVTDELNHTVRRITTAGVVTTLAGFTGARGSNDGIGTAARFNLPGGVAVDPSGNAYIVDTANSTVRKMTPDRTITTFAGAPGGFGAVNGVGTEARFHYPFGIAIDAAGTLYVADSANTSIRKIAPDGSVSTLAGAPETPGVVDGTGSAARFGYPEGVAVDASGNVYVADTNNHAIRRITPAGVVAYVAGFPGTPGSADGTQGAARFRFPSGIAVDSGGTIYVTDTSNHTIRKVTAAGVVTTFAGQAGARGGADGTGNAARFSLPYGITVDASGNVYVCDSSYDGALGVGGSTIRKITPAGVVTTLAGQPGAMGAVDGVGSAARFESPFGIAIDAQGVLYVAEYWNNAIRRVAPDGTVTTIGGPTGGLAAGKPLNLDGVGTAARFFGPQGIAVSPSGDLYVADSYNHTIRRGRPGSARLANLSVRSPAGAGSRTLIVGVSVAGAGTKPLLLRGVGPGLLDYGVQDALLDPRLAVYDAGNALVAQNDDWAGVAELASAFDEVGAFELAPSSLDAALLRSLSAGSYTAHVTSGGPPGVSLVEAYDLDDSETSARLTNVSARTVAGAGSEVLIVGFVVAGNAPRSILVRAVGPALAQHGVDGELADPRLELFSATGPITASDDWDALSGRIPEALVGAFELPEGSADAALVATLPPGAYTVQVRGSADSTGVALVELYEMP